MELQRMLNNRQVTMDLSYSVFPIDCSVRINGEPDHLLSGELSVIDMLDSAFHINFKLLYVLRMVIESNFMNTIIQHRHAKCK